MGGFKGGKGKKAKKVKKKKGSAKDRSWELEGGVHFDRQDSDDDEGKYECKQVVAPAWDRAMEGMIEHAYISQYSSLHIISTPTLILSSFYRSSQCTGTRKK